MNFICFQCKREFIDSKTAISHLRKTHKIKEKTIQLKCLVNNKNCQKSYLTYSGLRYHIDSCYKEARKENKVQFALHLMW